MGQMNVNENSLNNETGEINLFYNPYSWSQVANTGEVSPTQKSRSEQQLLYQMYFACFPYVLTVVWHTSQST